MGGCDACDHAAQNKCTSVSTAICCCLMATNQIFKQTPDTQWPCCYLAGPGDLDKSFVLWFIIFSFFQEPLLASCPSLVSHKAQCDCCYRQGIWDVQSFMEILSS